MKRPARPDFLILGAPKAGTTALHAALPAIRTSSCPPPRSRSTGCATTLPRHTSAVPGTSTPSRSGSGGARTTSGSSSPRRPVRARREHAVLPLAPRRPAPYLRAAARRPADRGRARPDRPRLQQLDAPVVRRARAGSRTSRGFALEHERIAKGWAPFWRYAQLGRYGEQLAHLFSYVDPRARAGAALPHDRRRPAGRGRPDVPVPRDRAGPLETIPHDNSRSFVEPGPRSAVLGRVLRAGAWAGQFAPPQVWRRASAPLITRRMPAATRSARSCPPEARARLLPYFADDIALLAAADRRVLRRLAVDREPRLVPRAQQGLVMPALAETNVTRSCAPSSRAAST